MFKLLTTRFEKKQISFALNFDVYSQWVTGSFNLQNEANNFLEHTKFASKFIPWETTFMDIQGKLRYDVRNSLLAAVSFVSLI